ncbi:ROK family protein [Cytophagaceae bacterium ABcell3]|nr:ROK family protein [Cytophagaceae bacterium ABcell3]
MHKIGIDLGGTKIEGIVLDHENQEIARKRIATEQEKGYDHILNNINTLYQHLAQQTEHKPHTFGIGTPGSISKSTGLMKNANTVCLNGKPFGKDLQAILKREVTIENDANCFAMAEAIMGAGKGHTSVFGVIMGTGCGGGIVFNEKIYKGLHENAGEWGHMTINPAGPECYCGKRGCVETYISGGGLEKVYASKYQLNKKLPHIVEDYKKGEVHAKETMEAFFQHFGIALSNLINILDPDVVVLGGGVSNIDELYTEGIAQVKKYIFNDELKTSIVKNKCGDSAGVWGAALAGI